MFYCSNQHAADGSLSGDVSSSSPTGHHFYLRTAGQMYDDNAPVWSGAGTFGTITSLAANTCRIVTRAYEGNNESVNSNVAAYKGVVNRPPQADAGTDPAVSADAIATLHGSESANPIGAFVSYQWTQTSGPSVTRSNATAVRASYTAPNVATNTTLGFQLPVTDSGGLSNIDSCQVTVLPAAAGDSGEGSNSADPTIIDSQTGSTKIWLEAEAGDLCAPMVIADDSKAPIAADIVVPNGNGIITDQSSTTSRRAAYTFDVPNAGDYAIRGRVLSPSNADNSFYASVDGANDIVLHTAITADGLWKWDTLSQRNPDDIAVTSNPLAFHLDAGSHTIVTTRGWHHD